MGAFMDITGIQTLEEMIQSFHKRGIKVLISGANSRVSQKLVKAGIVKLVGEQNVYPVFEGALSAALTEIEAQPTE